MRLRDWILICLHNDPELYEIDYIRLIFYDQEDIIMRFRFSKIVVIHIMNMLGNELIPKQRKLLSVTPITQLLVTLYFLANGSFQLVDGDLFKISQTTMSRVVKRYACVISSKYKEIIQFP